MGAFFVYIVKSAVCLAGFFFFFRPVLFGVFLFILPPVAEP